MKPSSSTGIPRWRAATVAPAIAALAATESPERLEWGDITDSCDGVVDDSAFVGECCPARLSRGRPIAGAPSEHGCGHRRSGSGVADADLAEDEQAGVDVLDRADPTTASSNSSGLMASSTRMLPVGRPTPASWNENAAPARLASAVTVATP